MKTAYILLTNNCNLHCRYCFQGTRASSKQDAKTCVDVLDGFAEFCVKNKITNAEIFGGEPFLYRDLFEYAVKALRMQFPALDIGVVTNGTLINESIMSLLEREHVSVLVSIDGQKSRHDEMRGGFDNISKWFSRLVALDRITVAIQAGRVEGLYKQIKYLWNIGFRKGVFINVLYNYDWYGTDDIRLFEQEYEQAVLGMLRGEGTLLCAARLYEILKQTNGYQECGIIGQGLAFDWNGTLYPCIRAVELGEAFAIGDIQNGIDYDRERLIRQRIRKELMSSVSIERYPMVSFCPVAIYKEFGSFSGKWNDQYCEMIQIKQNTVAKYYYELQKHLSHVCELPA